MGTLRSSSLSGHACSQLGQVQNAPWQPVCLTHSGRAPAFVCSLHMHHVIGCDVILDWRHKAPVLVAEDCSVVQLPALPRMCQPCPRQECWWRAMDLCLPTPCSSLLVSPLLVSTPHLPNMPPGPFPACLLVQQPCCQTCFGFCSYCVPPAALSV